jgi:2-polyprenyl-6-methoxyphenol hydroxylase-like FAD-dependent oxidoreductase
MASFIGQRAVVVGAGMGGLTAARALADHFERVLVLDGDVLPADPLDRHGVPQGRHVHALLAGGQHALAELFPGFEDSLSSAARSGSASASTCGSSARASTPSRSAISASTPLRCRGLSSS